MKKTNTKTNVTTGKKYSLPSNYTGVNTPYFSAGDYKPSKRPTPASLAFLAKGLVVTKERNLLEFLGQKVTLVIKDITALDVYVTRKDETGAETETLETRAFYVCSFPKGNKKYYFAINQIFFDTMIENGLLPKPKKENEAIEQANVSQEQLYNAIGQTITGYFYYTYENGSGKKLFPTLENMELYHNAIQANFEKQFESISDQTPTDQEKAN